MEKRIKNTGFTLLEIIVSLSLLSIAVIMVGSMYVLAQKIYTKSSINAELTQNGRVIMDRLSRELRQAEKIITSLPETNDDPMNPPADEIFFQDGHDSSQIAYLRYYLNGSDLMRSRTAYYFTPNPTTYVEFNSIDINGEPPLTITLEDRIIGEYLSNLSFWGTSRNIYFNIILSKNSTWLAFKSSVCPRN